MTSDPSTLGSDGDRGRLVDMAARLRPAARCTCAFALAAACVGLPTFGICPLIVLAAGGVLFEACCALLPRSRRPQLVVGATWFAGTALTAGALALASGPRLYVLAMFAYPIIFLAVLLPARIVAPAALATVLTIVGLGFALDAGAVQRFPPLVLYPTLTVLVTALGASLAREKDVASRRSAFVDELTGLLNRSALAARLAELAHQADARGEHVALIVADIDHFKAINDRHGHARGDVVLAAVARRMSVSLGGGASLYRLGGEEFVVLLPGATLSAAEQEAERLRATVAGCPVDDVAVTASFGVALSQPPGFDFDRVFAAADGAVYAAKRDGRDRVRVATPASTVVALRSSPSAERRSPARPPAAGTAAATVAAAPCPLAPEASVAGGWLARDDHERAQLVATAQRSQLLGLLLIYPCALAALLAAAPEFGWWIPVPPMIGAAVLLVTVAILPRLRRPERALALAWLFAEIAAACGWLVAHPHAGDSMLVALPALGLLVATFSPAFPPRAVAVGAAVSAALMFAVAVGYDPSLAAQAPGIVALAVALTVTVAVVGATVGRSTVDHLEVGVVDELTGLLNRAALKARVVELSRLAMRDAQIALIVGDLDQLKRINDEHGHAAGDDVLREVSRRVRGELRTFDTVYRIGGDEFLALLPSIDEDAATVAERLRMAVHDPPIGATPVTVSLGVALSPPGDAFDYDTLFARADGALYEAKRAGRDCVRLAEPPRAASAASKQLAV